MSTTDRTTDAILTVIGAGLLVPALLMESFAFATLWAWYMAAPTGLEITQATFAGALLLRMLYGTRKAIKQPEPSGSEVLKGVIGYGLLGPVVVLGFGWILKAVLL